MGESCLQNEPLAKQSRILVVDDDELTRIYLENALAAQGYQVTMADNFDAVKAAMQQESYALVLMDLVFVNHSYSGFDILEYIRTVCKHCGIVIMTSYPCTHSAVQALRIKASDYLTKPVKQHELISTVENILNEATGEPDTDEQDSNISGDRNLSSREMEVLQMLYKGYNYTEIAEVLECSTSTAKTYGKRVYKKLGVRSRSEAVYEALQFKLIQQ